MNEPSKAQEIKALLAAIVAFGTALWGWVGWAIFLLIVTIALDYVTGTAAAKAAGEWTSKLARISPTHVGMNRKGSQLPRSTGGLAPRTWG